MQELKQSTQIEVRVGPFLDVGDGFTPETGITLGAADEAELLKHNGAATVDISAATWSAVTSCDGWYDLTLTTSHTDTLGQCTVVVQDDSACLPVHCTFEIVTANYWDSKYSTDVRQVDVTQWNGTNVGTVDTAGYPVVTVKDGTGAGEINTDSGKIAEVSTLTGHTAQTGDSYARIGAPAGASIAADLVVIDNFVDDLETRISAARAGYLDNLNIGENVAGVSDIPSAATIADAVWDEAIVGHVGVGSFGEEVQAHALSSEIAALNDPTAATIADAIWDEARSGHVAGGSFGETLGTVEANIDNLDSAVSSCSTHTAANVWAVGTRALTDKAGFSISGAVTTLDGLENISAADVNTQCDSAIETYKLHFLLHTAFDFSATAGSIVDDMTESDGGVTRFVTNALEQAPTGGSNPNVLLDTTIAVVDSQTQFQLTAGSNDDDTYNNMVLVVYDASDSDYPSVRTITDYALTNKVVTIDSVPDFTALAGDGIKIFVVAPGSTPPTASQIADQVWDEAIAGHVAAGSFGEEVQAHATPIEVNTQCDTALSDYDPPTRAELTTDTNSILTRLGTPADTDIATDILAVDNFVDALETRLSAVRAGYLDNLNIGENVAGTSETVTAAAIADQVWDEAKVGHVGVGSFGEEVQSHSLSSEIASAVDIRTEIDSNSTQLTAIVADTDELQSDWVNGGRLDLIIDAIVADTNELQSDDIPTVIGSLNNVSAADVNTQCDAAIETYKLNQLFNTAFDHSPTSGSLVSDLTENDGGDARFTSNALEQAPSAGTNPNVLVSTTIASTTSQTEFTLTAGSNDNDAYNGQAIVLYDASDSDYPSVRVVSDYVGATKTITIDSAPDFTIINGDGVKLFVTAPGTSAPTASTVADAVWDENLSQHITGGTAGEQVLSLKANVDANL